MNKHSAIKLEPPGPVVPKRISVGAKTLLMIIAAVYGLISALWATYSLVSASMPLFVICSLAAAIMSASGLYLFLTNLKETLQNINLYVKAKTKDRQKRGGFIFGMVVLILFLLSAMGVLGYFTFQMLATQLHALFVNQLMIQAGVAKILSLVVVGVIVPVSLSMTFFDLFKPMVSARNGAEAWLAKYKKEPGHWIMFALYGVGSVFLAMPMVGVLLAGYEHFPLFVMNKFYVDPVSPVLTAVLAGVISIILFRALVLLHVKVNSELNKNKKTMGRAGEKVTLVQTFTAVITILLSVLVAIANLWTINHFKIWGDLWISNQITQFVTVITRLISPIIDTHKNFIQAEAPKPFDASLFQDSKKSINNQEVTSMGDPSPTTDSSAASSPK